MAKLCPIISKIITCVLWLSILCIKGVYADHNQQDINPRYAKGVVPITQDNKYFRTHNAILYWKISPYYISQSTNAECSLASAIMVINAAKIQQKTNLNYKLVTTKRVIESNSEWANYVKQNGEGVTLDNFETYLKKSFLDFNIMNAKFEVVHVTNFKDNAKKFHNALLSSERNGKTFIIINFDRKFINGITGDHGHYAPIGAYDSSTKRVLVMDPLRDLFEPYWVSERILLKSMRTEDKTAHKNRGFIIVTIK